MSADLLDIGALTISIVAWLLSAALLILDVLGRLPSARKRNARTFRLQLTSSLVLMTTVLLAQVGELAHWGHPIREAIDVLMIVVAVGTIAAAIIAAALQSKARRTQVGPDAVAVSGGS